MMRILPALAVLALAGCQTLGLSDGGQETAIAPPSTEATQPSVAPQPTIAIAEAWAAPTARNAKLAAGFLIVANGAMTDDRLVGATSPRAARVELHEASKDGKATKMRSVKDGITVPAGGAVKLSEDGLHLMFTDIDKPFVVGDTIPVRLRFEISGEVEIALVVKKREIHAAAH